MSKSLIAITGASAGLGAAAAKAFSHAGYPVVLMARRLEKLKEFVKENKMQNCLCFEVDVKDRESISAAIKQAENKYGPTDLLLNAAGVAYAGELASQSISEIEEMIDVNIKGPLNAISCVIEDMKSRKSGTIINIGSLIGRNPQAGGFEVLSTTKAYQHALSEVMRRGLAESNVRVMVVSPCFNESEMWKDNPDVAGVVESIGPISSDYFANAVINAYELPQNVLFHEICIWPTNVNM